MLFFLRRWETDPIVRILGPVVSEASSQESRTDARVDQLSVPIAQLVCRFLPSLPLCINIVTMTDIASLFLVVFRSLALATSASHLFLCKSWQVACMLASHVIYALVFSAREGCLRTECSDSIMAVLEGQR